MPRAARKQSPTGYYHVMVRGNNREMIFKDPSDKRFLLEQIGEQIKERDFALTAYCLMDNHLHLLIHSELDVMTQALKCINVKFAGRYNYKHQRVGHVFQGRFKSEIITSENHLLSVLRYIHNNPVKAKMVPEASDYLWSSFKGYLKGSPDLVDSEEKNVVMSLFLGSIKSFMDFHLEDDFEEFIEINEDLEREREDRALRIIQNYRRDYSIDTEDRNQNRKIMEQLVRDLIVNTKLPHRRIAELVGFSRGVIHSIAKESGTGATEV